MENLGIKHLVKTRRRRTINENKVQSLDERAKGKKQVAYVYKNKKIKWNFIF